MCARGEGGRRAARLSGVYYGADGHIRDRIDLMCESEDEAQERAKQLVDGHAVELWDRDQKVARFEPEH
jgi:hypothetical protein